MFFKNNLHIAIVGAGAVGGYVGGTLLNAGFRITFIDPWNDHVDHICKHGITISNVKGQYTIPAKALHISQVQSLMRDPIDFAILSVKSFDTLWATRMIKDYLKPNGFVVSMQNSINEHQVAQIMGNQSTLGCVLNTIGVSTIGPGHLDRHRLPGGGGYTVFRVGELHGRITPRLTQLVEILQNVDSSSATQNLWGERWSKLITNAMQMGILGATGLCNEEIIGNDKIRFLIIRCAVEGIKTANALGFDLEPIVDVLPQDWIKAGDGDESNLKKVNESLLAYLNRQTPEGKKGKGSLGRDVLMGRRSEIEYINGLIASEGERIAVSTTINRSLARIIQSIELGKLTQSINNIAALL